jgi:hypothetical protein
MIQLFYFLLFALVFSCSSIQTVNEAILLDNNYPRWLSDGDYRTDQTSGITFIKNEGMSNYFLLADDIGNLHLLEISNDTSIIIKPIDFSENVQKYLSAFPKKDFEEITYDKSTGEVFLSIEGNDDVFKDFVGIYKLNFAGDNIFNRKVTSIEKLTFEPANEFYRYTNKNIGYEGFALDNNYFYLGLEGFSQNYQFADSSVIFIAAKDGQKIIKAINTKSLGIHTICGLYSDSDFSLWGIDRNNRKFFHILLDKNLEITFSRLFDIAPVVPNYPSLNYNAGIESITMDDENNFYIVDDPWKEMYVPPQNILEKLDTITTKNFKQFIPIIYKYRLIYN